jgi:hypothetical protein
MVNPTCPSAERSNLSRSAPALLGLLAAATLLGGCLTHMPADPRLLHLGVNWQKDYPSLQAEAARTGKPMMICLIAGKIDGAC